MLNKKKLSLILIKYSNIKNIFQYIYLIYGNLVLEKKNYLQKICMLAVRICEKAGLFKKSDFTQNYIKRHVMLLNCLNKNNI